MTADEYSMYERICRSYDRANFTGEELFKELFETDDNGIIVMLIPPSKRFTSMEVYLFLMSIQMHQHLRLMHQQIDEACEKMLESK